MVRHGSRWTIPVPRPTDAGTGRTGYDTPRDGLGSAPDLLLAMGMVVHVLRGGAGQRHDQDYQDHHHSESHQQ